MSEEADEREVKDGASEADASEADEASKSDAEDSDAEDSDATEESDAKSDERRMPKKKTRSKKPSKKKGKAKAKPSAKKKTARKSDPPPTEESEGDLRFLCVHCGHRGSAESEPSRCPKCMRKGGIEMLSEDDGARPPWVVPAVVIGLVAAVAVGYTMWDQSTPDAVRGEVPLEPLSVSELRGYLRERDADGDHAHLFEANDAVEELAEHISGGSAFAKAESIVEHVQERAGEHAFVTWPMDTPRDTDVQNAGWAAERLAETEETRLYPLEVAAAVVAALREEDVDAMIAEIWKFPGDRVPPDPSGFLGYFGVAVYEAEVGEGEPRIYDPYGGHETQPDEDSYRVLNDAQAVAAAMGTSAAFQLVHENDAVRGLDRSRRALRVDGRSPYLRTLQGKILVAGAGVQQGIEELQSAAQIRGDGPRRNNLAGVFVVMSDVDQAAREAAAAIEEFPDFAGAHATLAAIHLAQGENDLAHQELITAERLESRLLMLPMLWANYFYQAGDQEQAVRKAREAVERNANNWETRFQAARLFRMVGRYDEMRRQAHAILELVQADQTEVVRQRILELLGPTALEPVDEDLLADYDDEESDLEIDDLGGGDLTLESDLLGAGDDEGGPSLLDEDLGGGLDLGGGAAGGFQLGGGGGSGPRLRFNE